MSHRQTKIKSNKGGGDRENRLKSALKSNMAKRKEQARLKAQSEAKSKKE